MSMRSKVLSNTLYLFANSMAVTVLSFVFWFVIGKTLMPAETGVYSTSVNFSSLCSTICLVGLNVALAKIIPEYVERKETGKIRGLVRFSTKIVAIASVIAAGVFVLFSQQIAGVLKIPVEAVLMAAALTVAVSMMQIFQSVLFGLQRMRRIFLSSLFSRLAEVALSVILIVYGFSFFGPLVATLTCFVIMSILMFDLKWVRPATEYVEKKRVISEYAVPAFVCALLIIILQNGSYVLLTTIKDIHATGIFTIAMVLSTPLTFIPTIFTDAVLPAMSQLSVNKGRKTNSESRAKQSKIIRIVFKYSLLISLPMAFFLVFFSEPLIMLYTSSDYLPAASLLPFITAGAILYNCSMSFSRSLYAIGKPKIRQKITLLAVIVFFVLALPLTYCFSALGMAAAYAASMLVFAAAGLLYLRRTMGLRLEMPAVVKMAVSSALAFFILSKVSVLATSLPLVIVTAVIGGVAHLLILVPLKFYSEEDFEIFGTMVKKLPVLKEEFGRLLGAFMKLHFKLFPERG